MSFLIHYIGETAAVKYDDKPLVQDQLLDVGSVHNGARMIARYPALFAASDPLEVATEIKESEGATDTEE